MNTIYVGIILLIQVFIFLSFGILLSKICKFHLQSLSVTLLSGFIFYISIFGAIALPMIMSIQPLSTLTYTFMAVTGIALIATVILCHKQYVALVRHTYHGLKQHSYMLIILLAAVFLQQLYVFNYIDWSADASYYIGKVTTDVYTNTMGCFDPYTGNSFNALDSRRVFTCFEDYNAVISQFFNIHPIKQAKLIMPQMLILFTSIFYYQIGLELFDSDKKKADLLVCFVVLLDFFSNTLYTPSTFLLTRTYEGKSILANILIPGLIYCFVLLWKKQRIRFARIFLFILSFSSCIFSSSSMLIIPVGVTAGLIPWIVKEKKWKELWFWLLCILPNLFVCIMYLLSTKGIVSYPIS